MSYEIASHYIMHITSCETACYTLKAPCLSLTSFGYNEQRHGTMSNTRHATTVRQAADVCLCLPDPLETGNC